MGAIAAFERGALDEARRLAEEQLKRGPQSAQLQHLLGLIECRSGHLDRGIDWLQRASQSDPANAAFRVMLVRALTDAGRAGEALSVTVPDRPGNAAELALWHARAEAADAAGNSQAAIRAWRVLCEARPGDWRAWGNYGEALAREARWDEAADALGRAVQLNPAESRIRQNLASALGHAGDYERCAAVLEQLVDVNPAEVKLRLTYARILADLGRTEDSMAQFEEAARVTVGGGDAAKDNVALIAVALDGRTDLRPEDISKADVDSVRELALLLDRTNRVEALRNLLAEAEALGIAREQLGYAAAVMALRDGNPADAKRLLQTEPPESDPARWHRLMSKIADALGDSNVAFAEAQAMNLAVHDYAGWRERGRLYREELRGLASAAAGWPVPGNTLEPGGRRSPAFLVGFPRSGTTLADTFLMGHPETRVLEEVHMLGAAETALGGLMQLPVASPDQICRARDAYFSLLDEHVEPGFDGLIIDKLPLNMMGLPMIHALFPDARIIFAQRHPCDSVLSGFMQSFVLNPAMACFLDIGEAADFYDVAMTLFSGARERFPVQIHTLVYEELIDDPASTLQPVIDFLGLEWRPELLDHRHTAAKRGAIITPSYDQVSEPLNKKPVGRWRRYRQQLEPALPLLLPWAKKLGYRD